MKGILDEGSSLSLPVGVDRDQLSLSMRPMRGRSRLVPNIGAARINGFQRIRGCASPFPVDADYQSRLLFMQVPEVRTCRLEELFIHV